MTHPMTSVRLIGPTNGTGLVLIIAQCTFIIQFPTQLFSSYKSIQLIQYIFFVVLMTHFHSYQFSTVAQINCVFISNRNSTKIRHNTNDVDVEMEKKLKRTKKIWCRLMILRYEHELNREPMVDIYIVCICIVYRHRSL